MYIIVVMQPFCYEKKLSFDMYTQYAFFDYLIGPITYIDEPLG
jgi:hypothetical protein